MQSLLSGVNEVWGEGLASIAASAGVQKISIMDTGAMDMQLITSNDGEGSWF